MKIILVDWQYPLFLVLLMSYVASQKYEVGVGRADCTGPSAEVTFMGYAKLDQKGCGIHLRQFSRAFVFRYTDAKTSRQTLTAFVSVDACMMNTGLKNAVLKKLTKYDFNEKNVILSGTHTHNGPGGFLMDVMLDVPNLGFLDETFEALVTGITNSIVQAYKKLKPADIYITKGDVKSQTNRNRSPTSYLKNPDIKDYHQNTDIEMVQLKFVDPTTNSTFGAINWFPVHPTSMNNTNCLVTSDNVGYASILLETNQWENKLPGKTDFVGAFASTNLGDVSPNLKDPMCLNTGQPCDKEHSTCNGMNKYCVSLGPGEDMFESTKIIANNLYTTAQDLLQNKQNSKKVVGPMKFIHKYVEMPKHHNITLEDGTIKTVKGCKPAMGYGFAAGTTDGPGEFDFKQATNTTNPFWNYLRDFIFPPSPEDVECHAPKPILIMSGSIKLPYEWQPEVVATQLLMIGNVVIAAVPGEFTTMSGRRMKKRIANTIKSDASYKNEDITVIIAGLSNTYTNYIATPEEYTVQRYEGASTIYGPHTLDIYLDQYSKLAEALIQNKPVNNDAEPYQFPSKLLSLVPPVLFDTSGWYYNFGDCIQQPENVTAGEKVKAKFIAGHPRNNPLLDDTFLEIQMLDTNSKWKVVANDASWETRFYWRRTEGIVGSSEAEIVWETSKDTTNGTYMICHKGHYKYILGGIYKYNGCSNNFTVTKSHT